VNFCFFARLRGDVKNRTCLADDCIHYQ
jgi:hypothetical protein